MGKRGPRPRKARKAKKTANGKPADAYKHTEEKLLLRPDGGFQPQFKPKKAPKTYRYSPSLDPDMYEHQTNWVNRLILGDSLVVMNSLHRLHVLFSGGRNPVKVTYDPEADALYIHLIEGAQECRVVRLTEDIALDFTEGEKLAGIEVLGASRLGITPDRPELVLERLRGVVAAAP